MISRQEIITYVKSTYNIDPDYPWARTPESAIFRHPHNRKWFGAILTVTADKLGLDGQETLDVLNVKCEPHLIGALRSETGIFPAWHMNKEHWLMIQLNSKISKDQVYFLLDMSYGLTK